jgi:prevent-host-death family protein
LRALEAIVRWQLQDAKQRFSEMVRRAQADGPQVVTRHGRDVVVVVDADEYERLTGGGRDLKAFLMAAPDLDALDIERSSAPARRVDLDS